MSNVFKDAFDNIVDRRTRKLEGKVNCIPSPFSSYIANFPGIEKRRYYIITANTKVGKSQTGDFIFLLYPIFLMYQKQVSFNVKIHYFSLEQSPIDKAAQFISNRLYYTSGGSDVYNVKKLNSTDEILPERIVNRIEQDKDFYNFVNSKVDYITDIRTVEGFRLYCEDYFNSIGKIEGGKYVEDDKELYNIFIWDHASLTQLTKQYGRITSAINGLSKSMLEFRNKYNATFLLIQQQLASAESMESQKFRKGIPTIDNLEWNKNTAMDCDYIFGIYSPARANISNYNGYDVTRFKDRLREMSILGGRWGGIGTRVALYFNGDVNHFEELPRAAVVDYARYNI